MINKNWLVAGLAMALIFVGVAYGGPDVTSATAVNAKVLAYYSLSVLPATVPATGQWNLDPASTTHNAYTTGVSFTVKNNQYDDAWVIKASDTRADGKMADTASHVLTYPLQLKMPATTDPISLALVGGNPVTIYTPTASRGTLTSTFAYWQDVTYTDIASDTYATTVTYVLTSSI